MTTSGKPLVDGFRGGNTKLVSAIVALLALDADGTLVPHGVGGHGRALLTAAAVRLTPQPADWTTPTTQIQRLGDAVTLLCNGARPSDEILAAWVDPDVDDLRLQDFASSHGPAWAQGIGLIDAAELMADQPTEGVEHEFRPAAHETEAGDSDDLEAELIRECERAMQQRDEFLRTGVSTAAHGGSHDTCFGHILRKHHSAQAACAGALGDRIEQPCETVAPKFPTMLRKMWSSGEVQAWIDANWPGAAA